MSGRRVVTGLDAEGRAVVVEDGRPPGGWVSRTAPGMAASLVWGTEAGEAVPGDWSGVGTGASFVPDTGGTRLFVMRFPPDSVYSAPAFDAAAFLAEAGEGLPGLAERFEPSHLGMHTTASVDYAIVLEGTPALELDNGAVTPLAAGDIVVQNGTRHAWRNPGDSPAAIAMVLVGVHRPNA